jgi:hypothetical protein
VDGLVILGLLVGYVALFLYIAKHARNKIERIAAIAVGLLIPLWDLPFGLFSFYQHCSRDAGTHIAKGLAPIVSVLLGPGAGYRPDEALKLGFQIVEYESKEGIVRIESNGSTISKSVQENPVSVVRVQFSGMQSMPWHVKRLETVAIRRDTGEVIARQTHFSWEGLWWQALAAPMLGNGGTCNGNSQEPLLASIARKR